MAPAVLDVTGFDRFVSDNDTVVVGFVEGERDAATFAALATAVLGMRPSGAFARVTDDNRELFDMSGFSGTGTAIFRGRVGMYLEPGLPAADRLVTLLDGIAALDMRRVQAELEQERAALESLAMHRVCPTTRRGKL